MSTAEQSRTYSFCIVDNGIHMLCGRTKNEGERTFLNLHSACGQVAVDGQQRICKGCAAAAIRILRKGAGIECEHKDKGSVETLIELITRVYAEHHQWSQDDLAVFSRYVAADSWETLVVTVDNGECAMPDGDYPFDGFPTKAKSLVESLLKLADLLVKKTQEQHDALNELRATVKELSQ